MKAITINVQISKSPKQYESIRLGGEWSVEEGETVESTMAKAYEQLNAIYADMLNPKPKTEEKKPEEERLTERQIRRNIRALDRSRIRTREILTGQNGRDCSLFELTVNAASWETGALAEVLASTAKEWFAR